VSVVAIATTGVPLGASSWAGTTAGQLDPLFSMSMSLLYWRAHNWTQHSRCCLTSAEQRARITSIDRLAVLVLLQPRIRFTYFATRAHCWLVLNLVSLRTPKGLFCKVAFQPASSQCVPHMLGVVRAQLQDSALPVLSFMRFLSVHFSSLSRSLWMAAQLFPPSSVSLAILPRIHFAPSFRSLIGLSVAAGVHN